MHRRDYVVKRQKMNRIRSLLKMFLTIIAVAVIFFLLFYVRKIEVTGNEYTERKEITRWFTADKLSGNSIVYLMKDKLGKVKIPPYLEEARIRMKMPWILKVTVKEKPIVAYAAMGDENIYFDKEGLVVLKKNDIIEDVPCIEGLDIKKAELYSELDVADKKVFSGIQSVTEGLSDNELVPDRIVCVGSDIMLYFGNVCVQLGNNSFVDKIGQISPILKRLDGQEGILHLEHYGQGTGVISFEKPSEAVPEQEMLTEEPQDESQTEETSSEEMNPEETNPEETDSEAEQYSEEDQGQHETEEEIDQDGSYDDSQTDDTGNNEQ